MLEARAHHQLKNLLLQDSSAWPNHLTLSRLVGRSLRRRDHTLIQLDSNSHNLWWPGLLVPLALEPKGTALVIANDQRQRLLQVELPRLQAAGLKISCWEGDHPPSAAQVWLLDPLELIDAHQQGRLHTRQLIVPEAEQLSARLRAAMAITIKPEDWERLRRAHPTANAAVVELHERLSRRLFTQATRADALIRLDGSEIVALKDLMAVLGEAPAPWPAMLKANSMDWASWAELDHRLLQWHWQLQPLNPLQLLSGLLRDHPATLLSQAGESLSLRAELDAAKFPATVTASLIDRGLEEPLALFAPRRQPLPNTEIYAEHLLEQSRRLILGRSGLTVVLLDDQQLRHQLTSELAAEFGRRVIHEACAPEINGVICCRWSWWLKQQLQLPQPEQLIIALLPLASLECPVTAARVEALKREGRDWFRELLLPDALALLAPAVAPIRQSGGRLAILDGRLRRRSWGRQILAKLEPWTALHRLLPD